VDRWRSRARQGRLENFLSFHVDLQASPSGALLEPPKSERRELSTFVIGGSLACDHRRRSHLGWTANRHGFSVVKASRQGSIDYLFSLDNTQKKTNPPLRLISPKSWYLFCLRTSGQREMQLGLQAREWWSQKSGVTFTYVERYWPCWTSANPSGIDGTPQESRWL